MGRVYECFVDLDTGYCDEILLDNLLLFRTRNFKPQPPGASELLPRWIAPY